MTKLADALAARGLVLVPKGGRPPKTARDIAVFLALEWFNAGAPTGRPKLREAVVDLWLSKGHGGIKDPAHVTVRATKGRAVVGVLAEALVLTFKGTGTIGDQVGPGAGMVIAPAPSFTEGPGAVDVHGPVWCWDYGAETARHFDARGRLEYN